MQPLEPYVGLLGVVVFLSIAYLLSKCPGKIDWRLVLGGFALQIFVGVIILKVPGTRDFFWWLGKQLANMADHATGGATFVLGRDLVHDSAHSFFVRVGSALVFAGSLVALTVHLGIAQRLIKGVSWMLQRAMGISDTEGTAVASNFLVGPADTHQGLRPALASLSDSQLFTIMVGGMAAMSGPALVAYTSLGLNPVHLLAASFMSAIAAIVIAKIMNPEDKTAPKPVSNLILPETGRNVLSAVAQGAFNGAKNAGTIMLSTVAAVAFFSFVNQALAGGQSWLDTPWTVQDVVGGLFTPFAWLMGVPWQDAFPVGRLMATEVLMNEYVSYKELSQVISGQAAYQLDARVQFITTFALCGFVNLAGVAFQIAALTTLVPERKLDIFKMGWRAFVAACLATWLTAALAGLMFVL